MKFIAFAFLATVAMVSRSEAQASLVILVRHAEKSAPTGDVGLSPAGTARAEDLRVALAGVRFRAIITTQYQRTRLTAQPVAAASGLAPIIMTASNDMRADAAAIARVVDSLPTGSAVLIVGHSNTLAPIIAALGGPPIQDLCDAEYSRLFVLERAGGALNLVQGHFGVSDPPRAGDCAH